MFGHPVGTSHVRKYKFCSCHYILLGQCHLGQFLSCTRLYGCLLLITIMSKVSDLILVSCSRFYGRILLITVMSQVLDLVLLLHLPIPLMLALLWALTVHNSHELGLRPYFAHFVVFLHINPFSSYFICLRSMRNSKWLFGSRNKYGLLIQSG